jgi:hypothetical protein
MLGLFLLLQTVVSTTASLLLTAVLLVGLVFVGLFGYVAVRTYQEHLSSDVRNSRRR